MLSKLCLRQRPPAGVASFLLVLLAVSALVAAGQDVRSARIRENDKRESWQRVPDILVALGVVPGARVADVGAGDELDPKLRGESRASQTKAHSLDAGSAERELRAAGFEVIGLRDPFVRREQSEEWLMIAQRGPGRDGV